MTAPLPPAFSINVRHTRTRALVAVAGELDIATATKLDRALQNVARTASEIDVCLQDVTFVDAYALTRLLQAHHRIRAAGQRIALTGISPPVARTLMQRSRAYHARRQVPLAGYGRARLQR